MSAILTVARREILTKLADRTFAISTAVTVAILAAVILLPDVLGFGGATKATVVASGEQGEQVVRAAQAREEAFDVELEVEAAGSEQQVRDAVDADEVDIAITGDGRLLVAAGASDRVVGLVQQASADVRAAAALADTGVDDATARGILDPPPAPVTELGDPDQDTAEGIAFIALIVLYGQLIGYAFLVATGIVEEKASRVVELLLSVVSPRQLLAGKLLGIGVVGLAQLLIIAVAGLGLGVAAGQIDIDGPALGAIGIVLAWFLLGYAIYSCAFAVAGALVPRQEEVQSVTTPLTMVLLAVFFVSFPALEDPGSSLAQTMSVLPFSAPMVMPVRMIAGDVPLAEVLLAVAVNAAVAFGLVLLAGRVYRAAALETGARISLVGALRRG